MSSPIIPGYYTLNGASKYLGRPHKYVTDLIAHGYLVPVKLPLSRRRYIRRADLDALGIPETVALPQGDDSREWAWTNKEAQA